MALPDAGHSVASQHRPSRIFAGLYWIAPDVLGGRIVPTPFPDGLHHLYVRIDFRQAQHQPHKSERRVRPGNKFAIPFEGFGLGA
jgi:hypothetical protein